MTLALGDLVLTDRLGELSVGKFLGEGAAGRVYLVRSETGAELALKWYKPPSAVHDQWTDLEWLLARGSPDRRFLWPLALAGAPSTGRFGYVMNLRPEGYIPLTHLATGLTVEGKPLDVTSGAIVELCQQISETFLRLHAQGVCYRDISLANVFFSPSTGDVLVCDVDNIAVDDGGGRVLGTGTFMAPEIVRDRSQTVRPSTLTDRHSLAVLLFVALMVDHPLEGSKTDRGLRDQEHLYRHFGADPLFSLHPTDTRNRPVAPHVVRYWDQVYPQFLRRLFYRAFVDGLMDPRARVGEAQWLRGLTKLRDVMGVCPSCEATVFYDPEASYKLCWKCELPLPPPLWLNLSRRRIVIGPEMVLTAERNDESGRRRVLGRGVPHPNDASRIGLRNLADSTWQVRYSDGKNELVKPRQAAELVDGATLIFPWGNARVERDAPQKRDA